MAKKRNYINNKDLHDEIVKSQEQDELTPKALDMLMMIAERANRKLYYSREEDRQDCIQRARMDMFMYWRGYSPKYKNALAYYTQMAKRGYAKAWNRLYPKKYKGTISMSYGGDDSTTEGVYSIASN